MRLCVNGGFDLHIIEPAGFKIDNKHMRRAGLDYYKRINLSLYKNIDDCFKKLEKKNFYIVSKFASTLYSEAKYSSNSVFLFGSETSGLPKYLFDDFETDRKIVIPMQRNSRSLNLSNAVSIVTYEAWRQINFLIN